MALGHKESTVGAMEARLLAGPSPNGQEEDLQNVVVVYDIGRIPTSQT